MKQAFYLLYKQNILRAWQQESTFLSAFRSLPGCQTCTCKHGIRWDELLGGKHTKETLWTHVYWTNSDTVILHLL